MAPPKRVLTELSEPSRWHMRMDINKATLPKIMIAFRCHAEATDVYDANKSNNTDTSDMVDMVCKLIAKWLKTEENVLKACWQGQSIPGEDGNPNYRIQGCCHLKKGKKKSTLLGSDQWTQWSYLEPQIMTYKNDMNCCHKDEKATVITETYYKGDRDAEDVLKRGCSEFELFVQAIKAGKTDAYIADHYPATFLKTSRTKIDRLRRLFGPKPEEKKHEPRTVQIIWGKVGYGKSFAAGGEERTTMRAHVSRIGRNYYILTNGKWDDNYHTTLLFDDFNAANMSFDMFKRLIPYRDGPVAIRETRTGTRAIWPQRLMFTSNQDPKYWKWKEGQPLVGDELRQFYSRVDTVSEKVTNSNPKGDDMMYKEETI